MLRKLSVIFVAALVAALPAAAAPLPVTADFQAKAKVLANCTITVSGDLDFGTYDPLNAHSSSALTGSTTLSVTCTRGSPSTITMSSSPSFGSGLANKRAMLTGGGGSGNILSYDLFQPSGVGSGATPTLTAWGDPAIAGTGSAFTVPPAANINARSITVFGSIPAAQDVSTGNYSDAVTATVLF